MPISADRKPVQRVIAGGGAENGGLVGGQRVAGAGISPPSLAGFAFRGHDQIVINPVA